APSMSWIAATSISAGFTVCIWPARSSSRAPNRIWMPTGSTRPQLTAQPASSAIRPSHSTVTTPPRAIQSICAGYASAIPKPPRHSFSSPTSSACQPRPSALSIRAAGRLNSSSSGSSSICGSNGSTEPENAVKTQIWIAVSVYVLVAIVKKRLNLDASLYTLLQILSVTLFEKMPINQALAGGGPKYDIAQINDQLNLF